MILPQTFETARLIVRPLMLTDAVSYERNFSDYEVIRHLSAAVPWPYPAGGAKDFIEHVVLPHQGVSRWSWAICLKDTPLEVIGAVEMWISDTDNRGFWLAKRHWGKGFMSEALEPITSFAFERLGFTTLWLSNAVGNSASRRVKEKAGATWLRTEPTPFVDPAYTEAEKWELTREAWWKSHRPTFIGNYADMKADDNAHYPGSSELMSIGAPVGHRLGLKQFGIHIETIPPGRRTSWPHAESHEEEFVFVVSGTPSVWVDGFVHALVAGDFVAFPAGTGIKHTFINDGDVDAVVLVGGPRSLPENKVIYAHQPARNEEMRKRGKLWDDAPSVPLGPHSGEPKPR
ncbi:MAG: GNAT family N-acetyltransferase [bacterium]